MVTEICQETIFLIKVGLRILVGYMFAVCQFLAGTVTWSHGLQHGGPNLQIKKFDFYQISVELAGWFGRCKTRMGWTCGVADRRMPLKIHTKYPSYLSTLKLLQQLQYHTKNSMTQIACWRTGCPSARQETPCILTLSDPKSDLVRHDFPVHDAFPHVVPTLANR
jgi:hypothetical protein